MSDNNRIVMVMMIVNSDVQMWVGFYMNISSNIENKL